MNFNLAPNRAGQVRGQRQPVRNPRPVRREDNDRWCYQQSGVKLLQITQDQGMVNVTLLRYTNSSAVFSTNTIWKLPFRLKHLKAFLMHPYLSDEERAALTDHMTGISTDQFKFEHLMAYRLTAICKALPIETHWENYTRGISTDHDWIHRLCTDNTYNSFVREVMEKNGLRVAY